jgi:hypothetical protein
MADDTTQRAIHAFFVEHLLTLEPFTKKEIQDITGWADKALDTYWSKQFRNFVEQVDDTHYRVKDRFRQFLSWKKFKSLVTQVKVTPSYAPVVYDNFVTYEFYLPLAHENALRTTLDSLFYKDIVRPRLARIGAAKLRAVLPKPQMPFVDPQPDTDEETYERAEDFVADKFGGYSIYHVDGRFRAGDFSTQQEATDEQKKGQRYLIDETTAVVRFIFPCKDNEDGVIQFMFEELFMSTMTEQISGEDEVWVVETGIRNRVHKWKPGE